ncbi:MAG: helix-turn-helix domain-containing protein [Firmicutes bacterium]|nr:helix-turn-helix domain-containing protein [Bacillota bacterium]
MEIFSKRLKEEREHCGLTQEEMAKKLGVSWQTYRNYEAMGKRHNDPSFELLVEIVKILNTSADYLLGIIPV